MGTEPHAQPAATPPDRAATGTPAGPLSPSPDSMRTHVDAATGPTAAGAGSPAMQPAFGPPAAALAPVVQVVDLRKTYQTARQPVEALRGVSLDIPAGRFAAIMGSSGSGKSTLLHLIGGLTPPSSGSVFVEGRDLARMSDRERTLFRRRRMGVVFQDFNLLPTLTAAENVALPRLVDGESLDGVREKAERLLTAVHLEHRLDHRPDAMSGGEQQRVAIARALLNDPAIILADEPTGNLDSKQSVEIWLLLRRVCAEHGTTVVMVTHEAQGAAYADDVIVLRDGGIIGTLQPGGSGDAALVATGYQKLVG